MKTDELLYEMMQDMNDKEAVKLEKELSDLQITQELITKERLQMQETLTMDKIRAELEREMVVQKQCEEKNGNVSIHFGRKRLVLLIAAAVMMLGMAAFAKENDWDIEMAEMLGLSGVMEELDGGYVKIGVSDTSDGITVTATQGIGDQNSMWVQLDTDLKWDVGEEGYYDCEILDGLWYDGNDFLTGSQTAYSFNNNGKVSFMCYFMDYENINRARCEFCVKEIGAYASFEDDEERYVVSDGEWRFEWKNYYAPNTVVVSPYKKVTVQSDRSNNTLDCVISRIEISPISMQIEAWKNPLERFENAEDIVYLSVDSITLKDGTEIVLDGNTTAETSNFKMECFLDFDNMRSVDVEEIDYITIGGENIQIAR